MNRLGPLPKTLGYWPGSQGSEPLCLSESQQMANTFGLRTASTGSDEVPVLRVAAAWVLFFRAGVRLVRLVSTPTTKR